MWDISHFLEENQLPSGLHTERKSYLRSLLMVRNFQRYSGYGLYSSYHWKRDSPWMKFLGLQLPTRPQFERSITGCGVLMTRHLWASTWRPSHRWRLTWRLALRFCSECPLGASSASYLGSIENELCRSCGTRS